MRAIARRVIMHIICELARLNEEQVIGMLFDPDFDSGGESEIKEDLAFPLPHPEEPDYRPRSSSPLVARGGSCRLAQRITSPQSEIERESECECAYEIERGRRGRARARGRGRGRARGRGRGRGTQSSQGRERSPATQGNNKTINGNSCWYYLYKTMECWTTATNNVQSDPG